MVRSVQVFRRSVNANLNLVFSIVQSVCDIDFIVAQGDSSDFLSVNQDDRNSAVPALANRRQLDNRLAGGFRNRLSISRLYNYAQSVNIFIIK